MTRRTDTMIATLTILAVLALNVLIGDEARGFVDGLVAGFTDAR